jgi:tetraacyldisaccharide 4'-kinase
VQALVALLVLVRRQLYQQGKYVSHRLPVPVVMVGNRVVGGAGKTPTVIALVQHLQQEGWTPGVLSRGHGRATTHHEDSAPVPGLIVNARTAPDLNAVRVGDEPWLIWQHTHVPLAVGDDRHAMGRKLLQEHPQIDILVGDDGLQHWALARDIEIVLFDERGGGNGWLLPAGLLREPVNAPPGPGCRQPALVLYNAPNPSTHLTGFMAKRTLHAPRPLAAWWAGRRARGDIPHMPATTSEHCWAVAGIAQPQRFFDGLHEQGLVFTPCPRPDHDPLTPLPWPMGLAHVIMTEKDAIKLTPERLARERPGCQVWVVPLVLHPEPAFWAALGQRLARLTTDAPTEPATEPPHGHPID